MNSAKSALLNKIAISTFGVTTLGWVVLAKSIKLQLLHIMTYHLLHGIHQSTIYILI